MSREEAIAGVKETLGMWWAKILIPMAFAIISAVTVYFYHHEIRTDIIEQDLLLMKGETARNREETREYLEVLREIAKGTQENKESMILLEARTQAIVERNNAMIDALIKQAERGEEK